MTSAQRIQHRPSSVAVLGGSLAIGASFVAGLVAGGPLLDLGPASSTVSRDSTLTDAGRSWQEQREQQTPRHWSHLAGSAAVDASGAQWLLEREAQTPAHVERAGPGQ